jgi:cytochrome c556
MPVMKFRYIAAAMLVSCLTAATVVVAADDPIMVRQGLMKQIGGSVGALSGIAKGDKPFDAAVVSKALTTIRDNAKAFPDQFPTGSETGMDTAASPKIWENKADFTAKSIKLSDDAAVVLAAMPTDQAGVATAMKTIGGECGVCHQAYRVKK